MNKVETLHWDEEFGPYKSQMMYDFAIALATANTKQGEDARHFYLKFCDAYEDAKRLIRALSEKAEHIEVIRPNP